MISIITINFNNASGLQKTIDSVIKQTNCDYEFLIIDGGSTDDSLNIIENNKKHITYWKSEKDSGIYDAQNKGIKNAKGEYLLFLNSGDTLYDALVLEKVKPYLNKYDIIYGDLLIEETDRSYIKEHNQPLTFGYFTGDTLPHQASFIKKTSFSLVGLYDETLKITADWKFFLDAICKYNLTYLHINLVVSKYDFSGISSKSENWKIILEEREQILQLHYSKFYTEYSELTRIKNLYHHSRFIKSLVKLKSIFSNS